jgi:aminopeptidase N
VIAGLWHPEQLELMEPYVDRYFGCIAKVWEERSGELAQNIVIGLYPNLLVDPSVVARTDAYLEDNDVQPALRRLLVEGRDGVARALRARERDAQG